MPEPTPPQLTPDDARALLHRAAATIDVGLAGPLDVSGVRGRRRRWPVLAAAALVVPIALLGSSVEPAAHDVRGAGSVGPTVTDSDGGRFRLGPDQVPSMLGQTADSARSLLESLGLRVRTTTQPSCAVPRQSPITTVPQLGTVTRPGDEVEVVLSTGPDSSCPDARAMDYAYHAIQLAVGTLPSTGLAGQTGFVTPDGVDLDPALEVLRERASVVARSFRGDQLRFFAPQVRASFNREPAGCGLSTTSRAPAPGQAWLDIDVLPPTEPQLPRGGAAPALCATVSLLVQDTDATAGMGGYDPVLDVVAPPTTVPLLTPLSPPDVVGNTPTAAATRLRAAGFGVDLVSRPDCLGLGLVTGQSPLPTTGVGPASDSPVLLGWTARRGACLRDRGEIDAGSGQRISTMLVPGAAEAFLRFAAGGAAPDFTDPVTIDRGDGPPRTVPAAVASDPSWWGATLGRVFAEASLERGSACGPLPSPALPLAPPGSHPAGATVLWAKGDCDIAVSIGLEEDGRIDVVSLGLRDPDAATVEVPDVVGLPPGEAERRMRAAELGFAVLGPHCGDGETVEVVDQSPAAGTRAVVGGSVETRTACTPS